VLAEDPDLAGTVAGDRAVGALEAAWACVVDLVPGVWQPDGWPTAITNGFGLLVLDGGLLLRHVRLGAHSGVEPLSSGDLLRPWDGDDAAGSVAREPHWEVLKPSRLAVLDIEFARRVSVFPEIAGQLVGRALRRSRWFAVNIAIVQQPTVEARLHMLLWHLADRWGTVRRGGVIVPIVLPHAVLAALVAARRPTVTTALAALEREGRLTRTSTGWVLHGPPPGALQTIA